MKIWAVSNVIVPGEKTAVFSSCECGSYSLARFTKMFIYTCSLVLQVVHHLTGLILLKLEMPIWMLGLTKTMNFVLESDKVKFLMVLRTCNQVKTGRPSPSRKPVSELEIGAEWQVNKYFELVFNYTISNRRYEDFIRQNNFQSGRLLRIQAQVNF